MGRLYRCLILIFFGFGLLACGESKQNDGGETAAAPEENTETADDKAAVEEQDPFQPLFDSFASELTSFSEACKAETSIQAPDFNFYSGFIDAASTRVFSNLAGVVLTCNTDQAALVAAQDAIIVELNNITSSIEQQEKLNEVMTFFADQFAQTGLQAHFESAVTSTTVSFGEGLTKKEDFLFNEGIVFLIAASFDVTAAPAAGTTTINFDFNGQQVQSTVNINLYTEAQLVAGQARYENAQGASPSCASCHQQANGTDHSPLKLGTCSDLEIAGAVSTGVYAVDAANPNSYCEGYALQIANHAWEFTDDAQRDAPQMPGRGESDQPALALGRPPGRCR